MATPGAGGLCPKCKSMLMVDTFTKTELTDHIDSGHTAVYASLYSRWSSKIETKDEYPMSKLVHHEHWMHANKDRQIMLNRELMLPRGARCRPIFSMHADSESLAESFFSMPVKNDILISGLLHRLTRISGIFDVTVGDHRVITDHNDFNIEVWWNKPIVHDIEPGDGALLFHGMTIREENLTIPPRL